MVGSIASARFCSLFTPLIIIPFFLSLEISKIIMIKLLVIFGVNLIRKIGHMRKIHYIHCLHLFEVNQPVFLTQFDRDPTVAITGMLQMQLQHIPDHRFILVRQSGSISLRTANLPQDPTGLSLRGSQLTASLVNDLTPPGRD